MNPNNEININDENNKTNKRDIDSINETPNNNNVPVTYKLFIKNLPKSTKSNGFKEYLEKNLGLSVKSADKPGGTTFAFISFANNEDMEKARNTLQNHEYKNKKLWVGNAKKQKTTETNIQRKKVKIDYSALDLRDQMMPNYKKSLELQYQEKESEMKGHLKEITLRLKKENNVFPDWLTKALQDKEQLLCEYKGIKQSPLTQKYRNKCQFTIGYDRNNSICIGGRLGRTEDGNVTLGDPNWCTIMSESSLFIRNQLNEYLLKTVDNNLKAYDNFINEGFWRSLMVRNTIEGNVMIVIQVKETGVEETKVEQIKKEVVEILLSEQDVRTPDIANIDPLSIDYKNPQHFVMKKKPESHKVVSIYWQNFTGISNVAGFDCPLTLLHGVPTIIDYLFGYKFQISPVSFFQTNTKGCEVLYSEIGNYLDDCKVETEKVVLLDIFSGAGTIGLTLSQIKKVKRLVGVEIIKEAVEDSYLNAKMNNIENCVFHCGKAEETLKKVLGDVNLKEEIPVAIVDPPRCGLHPKAVRMIRDFESIEYLIYVSCNQKSMVNDILLFCKEETKKYSGKNFVPVSSISVDMFPHTEHCEAIMLLKRQK